MPEYLAPGVYVEETSFRQKTIEGVSTSTAGFVGPARFGPISGEPELITSFLDFERVYGGLDPLQLGDPAVETTNHLAHAARLFFENGGRRLYLSRVYEGSGGTSAAAVPASGTAALALRARHPGRAGDLAVTFQLHATPNVLQRTGSGTALAGAGAGDAVWLTRSGSSGPATGVYEVVRRGPGRLGLAPPASGTDPTPVESLPDTVVAVHVLSASVTVQPPGRFAAPLTWDNLALGRSHPGGLLGTFPGDDAPPAVALTVPLVVTAGDAGATTRAIVEALFTAAGVTAANRGDTVNALAQAPVASTPGGPPAVEVRVQLSDGSDGAAPQAAAYRGGSAGATKRGLATFEDLEDISIVAAPGSSATADARAVALDLISHAERMRYRVAVLDTPPGQTVAQVRAYRAALDSTHAALYHPWVTVSDPISGGTVDLPPSGAVTGVYARSDVERGVHKAPANEVVRLALRFATPISHAQQEVLNPEGVSCLRALEGRGMRVWGARTISSDPEWKYLNVRRYFNFVERSIDRGTQWAVFEPNGRVLWDKVRRTVEDFLFNEWKLDHLLGDTVEEAYFVRCDRTTMTQNDLDNGRLVCLVGIAPLRPAEFVIFRIGQKTLTPAS